MITALRYKIPAIKEDIIRTVKPRLTQTILINLVYTHLNSKSNSEVYEKYEIKAALDALVKDGRIKRTKRGRAFSFELVGSKNKENVDFLEREIKRKEQEYKETGRKITLEIIQDLKEQLEEIK